ncbi:alpha/beta hydrolase [Flaviaesturariibacter amylovorans]|uniref:BD-FAE-like domain-containing protein n=1 Tax=Flaviaesturariibacter amylovorans TaxID=1084520 RepID=A0ABP8HST8_9BACT
MKQLFLAAAAAILLGTACTKRDSKDPWTTPPLAADSLKNEKYGSDPTQSMDVYLPAGRFTNEGRPTSGADSSTPVLIMIHGGAWSTGDKSEFNPYIPQIRQLLPHWAIANINYRLAQPPANVFPTQESDVQAAINYIYARRSQWHISDRFALLGYSAGGQLALLHSYKRATPVAVKAVLAWAGPSDMVDLYNYQPPQLQFGLQFLLGGSPATNPVLYQQSSAKTFVGPHNPPTFLVHGGLDSMVHHRQSDALHTQLGTQGVPASYLFYPNELHLMHDSTIRRSMDSATRFLRRYVY